MKTRIQQLEAVAAAAKAFLASAKLTTGASGFFNALSIDWTKYSLLEGELRELERIDRESTSGAAPRQSEGG